MSVPLFILYGSATGNAEFISKDLATKYKDPSSLPSPFTEVICAEGNNFKKKCLPIWETEPSNPTHKYGLVVVTSTTGNGDAPENGSRLVRYLKRKTTAPGQPMKHVAFGVLGLGDTNYDQFCETAKVVDKKLEDCGGLRVKNLGMADEGTGTMEDVVEGWVEDIVPLLAKACGGGGGGGGESENASTEEEKKEEPLVMPSVGSKPHGIPGVPNIPGVPSMLGSRPTFPVTGSRPQVPSTVGSRPSVPAVGSRPNVPSAMTGSRPNVPAVGSRPNVPVVGSRPSVPSLGSRPNVPAVGSRPSVPSLGSRPSVPSLGSRPNLPAVGSRPSVPSLGSRPNVPAVGFMGSMPNVAALRARQSGSVPAQSAAVATTEPTNENTTTSSKSPTPLCVLYGSATGNSEHIAKELANTYESMLSKEKDDCYFPSVVCCELDQYKKKCLSFWENDSGLNDGQKHGVLVVCSTTGNGDAPENGSRFVRYVKRKTTIEKMPFQHVSYAVLALGDTNYDQFCETGKIIDRKLKELGGSRIKDLTCADEGTGLEQVVDPWVKNILELVTESCRNSKVQSSKSDVPQSLEEGKEEETITSSDMSTHTESLIKEENEKKAVENRKEVTATQLEGVSAIRSLLKSISNNGNIPSVDHLSLPSLSASRSSCLLVADGEVPDRRSSRGLSLAEMDRMTISSGSSSGLHYTMAQPYESSIVAATYLTKTDSIGAKQASGALCIRGNQGDESADEQIVRAMKSIEGAFPLVGEMNSDVYGRNGKRVIQMKLSLPDDFTLEYQPGDSIGMMISNTPQATKFVVEMLERKHGIKPNQMVSVDEKQAITVTSAIRDEIDLCSPIKNKRLLYSLSEFATDNEEQAALRLLASKEAVGHDLFKRLIEGQRYNVVDILREFPSCQSIDLCGLLAIVPSIPPRYYSISSSPLTKRTGESPSLAVSFSVVDYMTPPLQQGNVGRRIGGIATRYLEAICSPFLSGGKVDQSSFTTPSVKIFPKPTSDFFLPRNIEKPIILIGPGTGIAPFMGFLAHRKEQIKAADTSQAAKIASEGTWRGGYDIKEEDLSITKRDASGLTVSAEKKAGEIDVYFGCRYSHHDWLYKDEMKSLEKEKVISSLNVAFSRDGAKKVYVQDKIKENGKRLADMVLVKGAAIYVCGDGNAMAKDVQDALIDVLVTEKFSLDKSNDSARTEAKEYLEEMKKTNRFLLDIWS